jgi:hypothetical protein
MSTVWWTEPTALVLGSMDSSLKGARRFFDLRFGFNEAKRVSLDLIYTASQDQMTGALRWVERRDRHRRWVSMVAPWVHLTGASVE